jgi:hypothetical protein
MSNRINVFSMFAPRGDSNADVKGRSASVDSEVLR